jgi:glucose-6-phosphate-specific signal transduction histidine kinase
MGAPRSTAVAAVLGVVVGIGLTLAWVQRRSERDLARELLRANELLADRLAEQDAELRAVHDDVAALCRSIRVFDPVVGGTRACDEIPRRP